MKVSEVGEFGLIDRLAGMIESARDEDTPAWQRLVMGIGDDAACWHSDKGIMLATSDCLVEGSHFRSGLSSWEDLGWKALAVNLSDIAAMGGTPQYALIALTLPGDMEVSAVTNFYRGVIQLAIETKIAIIGGNISSSPLFSVTITILGTSSGPILLRRTARCGDKVAVTGYLGGAAACLKMLENNLEFNPDVTISLRRALFHPCPRLATGLVLAAEGIKTAIDISDGLISDLGHICQASQVAARIETERIPVLPAVKKSFGSRALKLALSGGEDYELLFTGSIETIERVKTKTELSVTTIGEIIEGQSGQVSIIDAQGSPLDLSQVGWDHFARHKDVTS